MSEKEYLQLSEQLCFPLYATSRMITRLYQPLLDKLGLTYPQYLAMLVLWQENKISIGELGNRLYLNTNTITPMIKKMQAKGLILKERSVNDERTVLIRLTSVGAKLKEEASCIPLQLIEQLNMPLEDLYTIRKLIWKLLGSLDSSDMVKPEL